MLYPYVLMTEPPQDNSGKTSDASSHGGTSHGESAQSTAELIPKTGSSQTAASKYSKEAKPQKSSGQRFAPNRGRKSPTSGQYGALEQSPHVDNSRSVEAARVLNQEETRRPRAASNSRPRQQVVEESNEQHSHLFPKI